MPIILVPIDTQPLSVLLRDIAMWVPTAPEFDIERRAAQAVRDFCRITRAWRQRDTTLLTTVAGQRVYGTGLPAGTELNAIVSCWNGTDEVNVENPGEEEDFEPGHTHSEWVIGVEPVNDLRLTPAPNVSGIVLKGTLSFAPNEDATTLPDFIYQRWRTVIAHGAIAYLKGQKDKPWSDPLGETDYRARFETGCARAALVYGIKRRRIRRVALSPF